MNLTLPWKPHAKQRPRVTRTGQAYTPAATRGAEKAILDAFVNASIEDSGAEGYPPIEGPVRVTILLADDHFVLDVEPHTEPTQRKLRGDVDNYAKTILDALNGHAWVDDKQIVFLTVVKT
jgi:Holliday junction resolvase RusA-like endonuclease